MTTAGFSFDNDEGALTTQPALLVTDCKSPHDALHKERAAPSSTDKRLAIELASVKSRAYKRRGRLEVDRRTVPVCSLSHRARIEKI